MALNACELEIDLFCRGMRIPADVSLEGARGISRTRAGLGSGLEITIPTGTWLKPEVWVNVPVVEAFAQQSPYVLSGSPSAGYVLTNEETRDRYAVRVPQEPAWYTRQTSRDIPMNHVGVLQGTYLGIYVNLVCTFWNYSPALNCRYCTTGQNVGENESADKDVSDVVETCWAAKEESGVTFVHLNGGFQGSRGIQFTEPYIRAIKEDVGMLIGVQLAPEKDFSRYDRLIDLGVDHLSFCLEFWNPKYFAEVCPGKEKMLGQKLFMEAMEVLREEDAERGRVGRDHRRHRTPRGHPCRGGLHRRSWRVPDSLRLPPHGRRRHGIVAAAAVRGHARGDAARLRGLPAELDPDWRRAEHRGQPRREPGRCGAARAEGPIVLDLRGVPPHGAGRGRAAVRVAAPGPVTTNSRRQWRRGDGGAGPARRFGRGLKENPVRFPARPDWHSSCVDPRQVTDNLHDRPRKSTGRSS